MEDSNSEYEFFSALCLKSGIPCVSAKGKSNIYSTILASNATSFLVIADGAAFGPEMEAVYALTRLKNIELFLPESFEWLVLSSGLFDDTEMREMLGHPADFIDSERFFSWESFFTDALIQKTKDTYLAYRKKELNREYLKEHAASAIEATLPSLGFNAS